MNSQTAQDFTQNNDFNTNFTNDNFSSNQTLQSSSNVGQTNGQINAQAGEQTRRQAHQAQYQSQAQSQSQSQFQPQDQSQAHAQFQSQTQSQNQAQSQFHTQPQQNQEQFKSQVQSQSQQLQTQPQTQFESKYQHQSQIQPQVQSESQLQDDYSLDISVSDFGVGDTGNTNDTNDTSNANITSDISSTSFATTVANDYSQGESDQLTSFNQDSTQFPQQQNHQQSFNQTGMQMTDQPSIEQNQQVDVSQNVADSQQSKQISQVQQVQQVSERQQSQQVSQAQQPQRVQQEQQSKQAPQMQQQPQQLQQLDGQTIASNEPVVNAHQDTQTSNKSTDQENAQNYQEQNPQQGSVGSEQTTEQVADKASNKSLWESADLQPKVSTQDVSQRYIDNNLVDKNATQKVTSEKSASQKPSTDNSEAEQSTQVSSDSNSKKVPVELNVEVEGDKKESNVESKQLAKVSAYAFFIGILVVGAFFVLFVAKNDDSQNSTKEIATKETKISNLASTVEPAKPKVLPAQTEKVTQKVKDENTINYSKKEVQDGIYKYTFADGFTLLVPSGWSDCNVDFFASKDKSVGLYEYDKCPKKGDLTIKPKLKVNTELDDEETPKDIYPTLIISVSDKPLKYLADTSADNWALAKQSDYTSLDVNFSRYLAQNSDTGDEFIVLSKKLPNNKFVRISVPSDVKLSDLDDVLSTFAIDNKDVIDNSQE